MRAFYAILGLGLLAVGTMAVQYSLHASPREGGPVQEKRLIVVSEPNIAQSIKANVGDVIQFHPFSIPVARDFIDAKLSVKLSGNQTLQEIGQVTLPLPGEGKSGISVFFLVRETGTTSADVSLISDEGKPMGSYRAAYRVESKF